jgi:hypothetical protein
MQTDLAFPRFNIVQLCGDAWKKWRKRHARLAEIDNSDSAEMHHMARELGTSVSELRVLVGQDEGAADLLQRRLRDLRIDPAKIDPAVMRDLQRCCSQCRVKTLCEHELEDHPKAAAWPKYCPNEQTIDALVAEKTYGVEEYTSL